MSAYSPRVFYYFNSTHWDREWYQPFQVFRKYLVEAAGVLLDQLENGLAGYTFDGQTIVLDDVVEIRPDWRPRFEAVIGDGRLRVGPWYVMPDELLVSPEALVRNLLAGRAAARAYGAEPWSIGYVCDMFGHIAQLPQLLAGFGLEAAVVWRAVADDFGTLAMWRGPDGTVAPTIRLLPRCGYCSFNLDLRGFGEQAPEEAEFKKKLKEWVDKNRAHWGEVCILSDAGDHAISCAGTDDMLRWVRECYPDAEVRHSDYRDLVRREFSAPESLPRLEGEQIVPARTPDYSPPQISGTLASRYDVKWANDLLQNRLELLIEPQMAILAAVGRVDGRPFLDYLWRRLLQNHAHDSICGCGVDAVYRAMIARFDESNDLAERVEEDFLHADRRALTGVDFAREVRAPGQGEDLVRAEAAPDGRYLLRVHNPLPYAVERVDTLTVAIPTAAPYPHTRAEPFGYEFLDNFRLLDADGREIAYSIAAVRKNRRLSFHRQDLRAYDEYDLVFPMRLPATGWASFTLEPDKSPVRHFGSLRAGRMAAENGLVRLDIDADGGFSLTDLRSGRRYRGQNQYRFVREIGDGWNHVAPVGAPELVSSSDARVRVTHDGPALAEFEIVRRYRLPAQLRFAGGIYENYTGIEESEEEEVLEIVTRVALEAGADSVRVRTRFFNTIRDVKLTLSVPTGLEGNYFVGQSGAVLERRPGRQNGELTRDYVEPEMVAINFDGLIGKRGADGSGLALLSRGGLHEAGGLEGPEGELIVTLLRAFRRTVQTNGEPEGQLSKELNYEYRLKCLSRQDDYNSLHRQAQILRTPPPHYLLRADRVVDGARKAAGAAESFCSLSEGLAFGCLKPSDDGSADSAVLRVMNLSDETRCGEAVFSRPIRKALRCRLDETPLEPASVEGGRIALEVGPWKWETVQVKFG